MKNYFLLILFSFLCLSCCFAQDKAVIETSDINRFWEAYDLLPSSKNKEDSIRLFQEKYFDQASSGLRSFTKVRKINADCIVQLLTYLPKFWTSIRPNTLRIKDQVNEMEEIFEKFKNAYPEFKQPDVCFAIGCLSTGGTTTPDLILIGSEIVTADSTVNKSELNAWLNSVMYKQDQVLAFIAHESVHTQQKFKSFNSTLLDRCMVEGGADFIAVLLAGTNINQNIYKYGYANEKVLWDEFQKEMDGKSITNWLYQGTNVKDKPADLGYFMGYRICESYYNQAIDKKLALKEIMEMKDPSLIFKQSGYKGGGK